MKPALTLLAVLLRALLAALHAKESSLGVPGFGILRAGFFQALETFGAMTSKAWN